MYNLALYFTAVLGLHFLLFQHKHTAGFRTVLQYSSFGRYLVTCYFCQGIWCGTFIYWWDRLFTLAICPPHLMDIKYCVLFSLSSAILVLVFSVWFDPMLSKFEKYHSKEV